MSKEGMKNRDFPRIGLLLDLVNDAMEDEQQLVYDLSYGANFNDLKQPLTQHATLLFDVNISETVQDRDVVWNTNRNIHTPMLNGINSNDLQ